MVALFFWIGVLIGTLVFLVSLMTETIKVGPLVFSFLMLLAAAVAKYIGM